MSLASVNKASIRKMLLIKKASIEGRGRDVATRLKYHIVSIGLKVVQFGCPIFF